MVVRHNRKDPGKNTFTNSQDISLGYNFLRQENTIFGAWKSWTVYTPTNTTAKNGIKKVGWWSWKLTTELSTSSEQDVAFYPGNTAGRLDICHEMP